MAPSLDGGQVKKAVQALLAHNKTRKETAEKLLLNEDQQIFLLVTVWKIPPKEQVIKIKLPHSILKETSEVCLFTKDEPSLTAEQTENLYRKLLTQHGIKNVTEVISYKTLKREYKPFEAKRRLLSRFVLFLSDDRIRRLLPSQIGKHFYKSKKAPLSVDLKAKNLAKEINRYIQGTTLPITNKGCSYSARIGHTGMNTKEILENVIAATEAIAAKAPQIWKSVKILHLKMDRSVALPIFTCSDTSSDVFQKQSSVDAGQKDKAKKKKQTLGKASGKVKVGDVLAAGKAEEEMAETSPTLELEEEDGEIPQLVPIATVARAQKQKVEEPSSATRAGVERKIPTLLGKRKTSLSPESPVITLEVSEEKLSLQTPKLLKQSKKPKTPKKVAMEKKLANTPQRPTAKSSSVKPAMEKMTKSSKKAPSTPKHALRKRKPPQSV